LVENRRFNLPHLYLAPRRGDPVGISPRSLASENWNDCPFTLYKNIADRFFGLVTKHACDRQTDEQTNGQMDRITTPKTAASRGKKSVLIVHAQ